MKNIFRVKISFFLSFLKHKSILAILVGIILATSFSVFSVAQQAQFEEAYLSPPASVQEILNRDRHYDVLNAFSPDGDHFMIPIRAEFSSLKLMAQKTYRLAMLELCPDVNREWRLSTTGIKGLKIYSLSQRKSWAVQIPDGIFISDMTWSPHGEKIAFLAHLKPVSYTHLRAHET